MQRRWRVFVGVIVAVVAVMGISAFVTRSTPPRALRLNDLQLLGTHNSYHVPPSGLLYELASQVSPGLQSIDYSHPSLTTQLETEGVRQIELDVWADPDGTHWAPEGVSGFKVFHSPGTDSNSVCDTLAKCLGQVVSWSEHNPNHLPVAIAIEPKDQAGNSRAVPMSTPVLDALDAEIRSLVPRRQLLVPDDVRGDHKTLDAAVRDGGWPTVDSSRGKLMFLLITHRDLYIAGHPTLQGRVMFTPSSAGQPDAAFVKIDDPRGARLARIRRLVSAGYVVRTRADLPVDTPKSGDVQRRADALASGAQWISTDYPVAGEAELWGSEYVVQLPGGGLARCNPVRKPEPCNHSELTEVARPTPAPTARLPWFLATRDG